MHGGSDGLPRPAGSAGEASASPRGGAAHTSSQSGAPPDDSAPAADPAMSGVPHDGPPEGTLTHEHDAIAAISGHVAPDEGLTEPRSYLPPAPAPASSGAPTDTLTGAHRSATLPLTGPVHRAWSAFDNRSALGLPALLADPIESADRTAAHESPLPPRAEHATSANMSSRGGARSAPPVSRQASVPPFPSWLQQHRSGGVSPSVGSEIPPHGLAGRRSAAQLAEQVGPLRIAAAGSASAAEGTVSASASASWLGTSTSSRSAVLDMPGAPTAAQPLLAVPPVPQAAPPGSERFRTSGALETQPRALSMRTLKLLLDSCDDSPAAVRAALRHTTPDFAPGLPGLTKLISKFSKEGNWRKALAVFRSVPALGLRADTTIMNAAIAACGVAQDTAAARSIFDAMPGQGVAPDTITYKAMVMALTRCQEWQDCVEIAEDMFRTTFSRNVNFQALDDLALQATPSRGSGDATAALHARVRDIWRLAPGAQGGIEEDPMGRACCNAMLAAYADAQQSSRGLALLMTMMRSGANLTPDIVSFNAVVSAFAGSGDVGRALSVLDAVTVAPTIHTFKPVMHAALVAGQRDLALELWDRALRSNVAPDTEALNLLLQALVEPTDQGSLWPEARRVLSVVLREDLSPPEQPPGAGGAAWPDSSPLDLPGRGARRTSRGPQPTIAEQLSYCLQGVTLAVDAGTMRIMMQAALQQSDAPAALSVFQALIRHRVVPDVACVNAHMQALARLGEWLLAWHTLRNALRGVGIDLESLAIMSRLLRDVCSVAAEHSPGLVPHVHQLMDEVNVLHRLLEGHAAAAGAPARAERPTARQ